MKPYLYLFLPLLLAILVVAPPIFTLVDYSEDNIALVDMGDEGKNKEAEKELDEKEFFIEKTLLLETIYLAHKNASFCFPFAEYRNIKGDILLPPPERTAI